MINKITKYLLVVALSFFAFNFFVTDVYAVREICTSNEQSKLTSKAHKIEFTYTLKFNDKNEAYFEVMYVNLQPGLEIRYGENTYTYSDEESSGTIKNSFQNTGLTYEFEIYAAYGYPCVGELLYTKTLKLPKYNKYSEYDQCIEYEEFPMCHKWYEGEIENEKYFLDKLEEYKKSLEKPIEKPPVVEEEKNIFEKFIDFYVSNLIISLPVTILIIVSIVFVVIRNIVRRKNRVKIDI